MGMLLEKQNRIRRLPPLQPEATTFYQIRDFHISARIAALLAQTENISVRAEVLSAKLPITIAA